MHQPILEELEKAADEILSKAKDSESIDPEDIAEDAENAEDIEEDEDEADGDSEEPEDDEDDDEDDDDESEINKSIDGQSIEDEMIGTESMSALVEIFAKSLSDVMENVSDSRETSENTSTVLMKSLLAQNIILGEQKAGLERTHSEIAEMQKSLADRLDAIEAKLDTFSTEPAHMRKSVASYGVMDRDFKGSIEGMGSEPRRLSKSEAISILSNELTSGSQIVTAQDILSLEAGGTMRPEIRALLDSKTAR